MNKVNKNPSSDMKARKCLYKIVFNNLIHDSKIQYTSECVYIFIFSKKNEEKINVTLD